MITFIKFVLLSMAFFITLLWITKLITDCISAMYGGNFSEESAERDGALRVYMIIAMSLIWPTIIIIW